MKPQSLSRSVTLQRTFRSSVIRGFGSVFGSHVRASIIYNRFARGPCGRGKGGQNCDNRTILPKIRVSSPKSPSSSEAVVKKIISRSVTLQRTFRASALRVSVTPCENLRQSQFSDRGSVFGSHGGTKARSLHDAAHRLARRTFAKAARYDFHSTEGALT
jgi:hypothetical protein